MTMAATDPAVPVVDVRRLTIHDGPGIRNTVFVKGCPLHCRWCHNPESISAAPRLQFHSQLCVRCGTCVKVCPEGAHTFSNDGEHLIDRSCCNVCGTCVNACLYDALRLCGTPPRTVSDVFEQVIKDRIFYKSSNGGVTASGGEPLMYPEFIGELFQRLRAQGIHTALDTCGAVPFENFTRVLPFTSLVLYDLKGMDPQRHLANTGRTNVEILENLQKLDAACVPVEIRMPIVPGCNDRVEEFEAAGGFLSKISSLSRVRLLPYHAMARGKYASIGMIDTMPAAQTPTENQLKEIAGILRRHIDLEIIF